MNINDIIQRQPDGSYVIQHWVIYYLDIERTHRYEMSEHLFSKVYIEEDYCYLLDRKDNVIWESGQSLNDIRIKGDLFKDVLSEGYGNFKYDRIPWLKIGIEVTHRFKKIKEDETKEAAKRLRKEQQEQYARERRLYERKENVYLVKSGREWINKGKLEPKRKNLWKGLWREQEICILFAASNIGKSIYATQIGFEIARNEKVIYFDYEMDYKDFEQRYSDSQGGDYPIPAQFIRCEPDREVFFAENSEDILIRDIEQVIIKEGAKVVILDNLTYISKNSQSSTSVSILMYKLKLLQKRHGLSMLILAHTPKRNMRKELTQDDLAGSKKIFNFVDSCFAMGQSVRDSNLQYLKQLKARGNRIEYGADNVILLERRFENRWLHFETIGHDLESNHLQESKQKEFERIKDEIHRLLEEGLSQRDVAKILKISESKVRRLMGGENAHIKAINAQDSFSEETY